MKTLRCSDLGALNCTFSTTGYDTKTIKENMFTHAANMHPKIIMNMTEKKKERIDKKMDRLLA